MTTTYADISLINTTYNTTHTFDDDVAGAGLVESLSVSPNYGGGLTELMTGGSSRENGFPSSTSVSIAGVISGDGGSNKASTTIKKIGQILHDGKLKIRFGQDDLELTDCVMDSFSYAPVAGGGSDIFTFSMSITSGAKYFTETSTATDSQSIAGSTYTGTITHSNFDSDAPTKPIITITRTGSSTIDTSFTFRAVNSGQTTTPEFRIVSARMGVNDVLTIDPFLETAYISTNNSGSALVPKRMDAPIFHLHKLSGTGAPQVQFQNTTSHSDFTVAVVTYKYRLCFTSQ
tara:strand:+ start:1774 stop:2640 length:867 start_codon:yes stop_codon:yes gene_type:complete